MRETSGKKIGLIEIVSMGNSDFNKLVKEGYEPNEDVKTALTDGKYREKVHDVVLTDIKTLKRCLQLLGNSGLRANFTKYNFDYNMFKTKANAVLVLDTVDIGTIDHNIMLEYIIKNLDADILARAIDDGVLDGVSIKRYILMANSLGKTEQAIILASHDSGDKVDDLSLDSEVQEDEWEYTITPKMGLQLTKYIGTRNIVVIPNTYNGKEVNGLKSSFLDDNPLAKSTTPIVVYYHALENDSKDKLFSIFYAMANTNVDIISTTNLSEAELRAVNNINRHLECKLDFCGYNFYTAPIIEGDNIIYNDAEGQILVRYLGNAEVINISNKVINIYDFAFKDCNSIKSINIPSSVKSIGDNAFMGCNSIKNVVIDESNEVYQVLANCIMNKKTRKAIFNWMPSNTDNLIPEGTTNIEKNMFENNNKIKHIDIPNGIKEIGAKAFCNCKNLKSITIPNSVKKIGQSAFAGCCSLVEIEIPDSVNNLGANIFEGCTSIEKVKLPNKITSIKTKMFSDCSSLKDVNIPESVTSIGQNAFYCCKSLTSVIIPESVTVIGQYAFGQTEIYARASLKPKDWEYLWKDNNDEVFWDVKEMQQNSDFEYAIKKNNTIIISKYIGNASSLEIPKQIEGKYVVGIAPNAFNGCHFITSVKIPSSIVDIEAVKFENSNPITIYTDALSEQVQWHFYGDVSIIYNVKEVQQNRDFEYAICNNDTITISKYIGNNINLRIPNKMEGKDVVSIAANAFAKCGSLSRVDINDITAWLNLEFYDCRSNPLYCAHELYLNGNLVTDLEIPDGVTSIGAWTFCGCTSLKSVTIPKSMRNIGYQAFADCDSLDRVDVADLVVWCNMQFDSSYSNPLKCAHNLYLNGELVTNLDIPYGVESIGDTVFSGCSSLTSITIPESVTSIGKGAFSGCSGLASITMSKGIKRIGNFALSDCSGLASITMPASVRNIGACAFSGCSSLTSINIPSSVKKIDSRAFEGCSSLTIYTEIETQPWKWDYEWNISNRPVVWGYKK